MRRSSLTILAAFALVGLLGCGGGAGSPAAASQPGESQPAASSAASPAAACATGSSGSVAATIEDFAFSPDPISAKVDEAIEWSNNDGVAHTVTLDEGDCDTGNIAGGQTAALMFNAPGTYPYHCKIHPQMTGTITITE